MNQKAKSHFYDCSVKFAWSKLGINQLIKNNFVQDCPAKVPKDFKLSTKAMFWGVGFLLSSSWTT